MFNKPDCLERQNPGVFTDIGKNPSSGLALTS